MVGILIVGIILDRKWQEIVSLVVLIPLLGLVVLTGVWLYRTSGFGFAWQYAPLARKCLPNAWTALCVVLFVILWTPYEPNRRLWSGYLDVRVHCSDAFFAETP